jgi:hypothetical protein
MGVANFSLISVFLAFLNREADAAPVAAFSGFSF